MTVAIKRGISVAPFEELSEPRVVMELAARAERRGWNGFFVWDHVAHNEADAIAASVRDEMQEAVTFGLESPLPAPEAAVHYVYA